MSGLSDWASRRIGTDLTPDMNRAGEALPDTEGTHCANCKALKTGPVCGNGQFVAWQRVVKKATKPENIPAPGGDPKRYCCIWWTHR